MAFLEFAQILWEASKPTIDLTDNKSNTRFFLTKDIPPSLWKAWNYVVQFDFKIAHITGSVNTAADFFSKLQRKVTEKIRLKFGEDVQTTAIEVKTSSSDVADEENFFLTQKFDEDETAAQTLERKEQFGKKATEWVAD